MEQEQEFKQQNHKRMKLDLEEERNKYMEARKIVVRCQLLYPIGTAVMIDLIISYMSEECVECHFSVISNMRYCWRCMGYMHRKCVNFHEEIEKGPLCSMECEMDYREKEIITDYEIDTGELYGRVHCLGSGVLHCRSCEKLVGFDDALQITYEIMK